MKTAKYEVEKMSPEEADGGNAPPTPLFGSARLALAIIGFFMFFHLYAQRIGMSVAIVCMVNHTAIAELKAARDLTEMPNATDDSWNVTAGPGRSEVQCARALAGKNATVKDGPFVWEKDIQGHILGSFFYGYLLSQVPGGMMAERFGGKWVLVGSLGLSTAATLLTPAAARLSFVLLIILRFLVGIGSGALYPAMHAMLGQWTPPLERSKLCGITYAGAMMGNVVTLPLAGILCQYGFDEGWGSVFYIIGISSTLTIVLWALLTSNTPATHPRISRAEKAYILDSLRGQTSDEKVGWCSVPWGKMMCSGAVWALIIANFTTDWGLYTYLTNIPTFYKEVLFFDIQSNGLYSALPFLGLWLTMSVVPIAADKLQAAKLMSTAATRKLFNTIGLLGPATFLIGLSFVDCSQTGIAVALLVLAVTVAGFVYSGYFVNHMDIAPQYAGTLMGIANGLSASAGFIAPYVASVVTKPQTRESWQIVFFIAAAVYAVGAVAYLILAKGTIQPWAVIAKPDVMLEDMDHRGSEVPDAERIYKPSANGHGGSNSNVARSPPAYDKAHDEALTASA